MLFYLTISPYVFLPNFLWKYGILAVSTLNISVVFFNTVEFCWTYNFLGIFELTLLEALCLDIFLLLHPITSNIISYISHDFCFPFALLWISDQIAPSLYFMLFTLFLATSHHHSFVSLVNLLLSFTPEESFCFPHGFRFLFFMKDLI